MSGRGSSVGVLALAVLWAVVGYAETLAMELADTGINVRCACPQVVRTPMLESIVAHARTLRLVPAPGKARG